MPSFIIDIEENQAFLSVEISHPINKVSTKNQKVKTYLALLDTGAQQTLISPQIVSDLGFVAIGPASLGTASGDVKMTKEFRIGIGIPAPVADGCVLR
ncbi:MAG: aspartyl protease family protein [Bacteroidota bacterium]|nr:aspartyl protease family protein [Bacteroidota bacterium]